MDQQLKLAEDEAQEYQAFLQKLENESEEDNRVLELEAELEKIQMEEASLQKELQVGFYHIFRLLRPWQTASRDDFCSLYTHFYSYILLSLSGRALQIQRYLFKKN